MNECTELLLLSFFYSTHTCHDRKFKFPTAVFPVHRKKKVMSCCCLFSFQPTHGVTGSLSFQPLYHTIQQQ